MTVSTQQKKNIMEIKKLTLIDKSECYLVLGYSELHKEKEIGLAWNVLVDMISWKTVTPDELKISLLDQIQAYPEKFEEPGWMLAIQVVSIYLRDIYYPADVRNLAQVVHAFGGVIPDPVWRGGAATAA